MRVGADVLLHDRLHLLRGKRIGVVTNHSAILGSGEHLVDALAATEDVEIVALFGPEHGIRGLAPDRKRIENGNDAKTGAPVFSLFGKTFKPTKQMLRHVDLLLFDMQDVGARFYTYTTTLALTMEAAAEKGIPYVVLDRPNPIGGCHIEGPVREVGLKSFVGWLPLPIVHGLTVGEIARMINGEGWLKKGNEVRLKVVKMAGWRRSRLFDQTHLTWINPSPSIRNLHAALVYPGTCLIEGTNVSEGRGTEHPFEQIGAPWINGNELAEELNSVRLPGVEFEGIEFTPRSTKKVTTDSKYEGETCEGVFIQVTNRSQFRPAEMGIHLLSILQKLYTSQFRMKARRLDELVGSRWVRLAIHKGVAPEQITEHWKAELREFNTLRKKYLLYR